MRALERTIWLAWTVGLTVVFAAVAGRDLGKFRPVSSDDIEIMAVSYKLAEQGVLGSDLQTGFFHAEDHHFLTLPVQHVLQALSFRLFGAGIPEARGVTLTAALVLIWLVGWLAWRWYGLGAGLASQVLLVAWPSDLVPGYPGLPLLAVARSARYDLTAVAFVWLSLALLDATLAQPGRLKAFATGLCAGLAALTQFFGAFALPLIGVSWLSTRRRAWRDPASYWMLGGAGVVVLPYAIYAAWFAQDVVGQWSVHADREGFLTPAFYVTNLLREPARFAHLLDLPRPGTLHPDLLNRPISPWLLVLGTWPALVWLGHRVYRTGRPGDRMLLFSLLVLAGGLALLDATKAPLYGVLLLPSVCVALAGSATAALRWVWRSAGVPLRVVACSLAVCLLATMELEGLAAYQADRARVVATSGYQELGDRIEASVPPEARVLGPERWWWPLHDHPYLALRNVWRQWELAAAAGERMPQFQAWLARDDAQFVVINDDVRQDITVFPEALQRQFWAFLDTCSVPWADWSDVTYGDIQVRRVASAGPGALTCETLTPGHVALRQ